MAIILVNGHEVTVSDAVVESNKKHAAEQAARAAEHRRLAALEMYAQDKQARNRRPALTLPEGKRRKAEPARVLTAVDVPKRNHDSEYLDPYTRLWSSVLLQSIADATALLNSPRVHKHNSGCPRRCKKLKYTLAHVSQSAATEWFRSSDTEWAPCSFLWVARVLNLDPQAVRARIDAIKQEKREEL
jgi:hypothetical protein